jgi:hypothetical protein
MLLVIYYINYMHIIYLFQMDYLLNIYDLIIFMILRIILGYFIDYF